MKYLHDNRALHARMEVTKNELEEHSPRHSTALEDDQSKGNNANVYNVADAIAQHEWYFNKLHCGVSESLM